MPGWSKFHLDCNCSEGRKSGLFIPSAFEANSKQYCVFHLEINSRSRSSHRQKESSGVLRGTDELSVASRRAQTQHRLSLQRAEDQKRQWRKIPSRCSQTSACMYAPDECQAESSFMSGFEGALGSAWLSLRREFILVSSDCDQ